ncbi:MAG: ABC transporter permease [Elusimicrobia bacterium]|nr:ABC transporter permease [Elusimicrobiota bacterium]
MFWALVKLAMRNVMRNKRRSGLTLASVVIGVAALFFNQSLIKSLQADMVDRAIGIYNSHIQIQAAASQDPKIPERTFGRAAELEAVLKSDPDVEAVSKRVLCTGLVASAVSSVGTGIFAIDPDDEQKLSQISSYIKEGRFLNGPKQIILGSRTAQNLDIKVGEKVVVMAQNREGSFEGRALRVVGIFETGSYTWDATIVYAMRQDIQDILAWGDEINVFAVKLKDPAKIEDIRRRLTASLKARENGLKILTWKDVGAEIIHIQEFQDSILFLILIVIFVIVALGNLNTMLMSLFERIREFGLMMALGAKRGEVGFLLLVESACLGLFGLFWGAVWGLSIIVLFHFIGLPLPLGEALSYFLPFEKVLYLRFAWPSHAVAALMIVIVSCIAGIIPALRIRKLRAAEALRHV